MYDDNGMNFPVDLSHQIETSQNHERNNTDTVETYNDLGHSTCTFSSLTSQVWRTKLN